MLSDRIRQGVVIGLIGGAATAGALVGLGMRHGVASLPFAASGSALFEAWRLAAPTMSVAVVVGIVAHLMWSALWGVCFSVVALGLRGIALPAGALLFVLLLGALSATAVPGALGAAAFATLSTAQTAFLLTILAGAFIAGVLVVRHGRGLASGSVTRESVT